MVGHIIILFLFCNYYGHKDSSKPLAFLFFYQRCHVHILLIFWAAQSKGKNNPNLFIKIYKYYFSSLWLIEGLGLGLKKMVTRHSVFITHHLKHLIPFCTITHLSSLNIFQLFMGPIHVSCAAFTFFFFSFNPQ